MRMADLHRSHLAGGCRRNEGDTCKEKEQYAEGEKEELENMQIVGTGVRY